MHPRTILSTSVLSAALLAGACGSDSTDATSTTIDPEATTTVEVEGRHSLTGEVVIRDAFELSHLPEGSRIVIRLEDISIADASSVTIAEATTTTLTLPLTYELRWDTDLEPGRDYSVSAQVIGADGDLLFVSDTVHPYQPGDQDITVELVSA